MIISASYRTDIPTFYGKWFINRLEAGFCKMVNPYSGTASRVSLRREDVDGFVFWTKNLGPFLDKLAIVRAMGYPFMVQYSINGYPRALEVSVVDAERSVSHMRTLAEQYGKAVGVWRYDPILITSETPVDFHQRNFPTLARALEGTTDEVVVSFAQMYRKTLSNLKVAAESHGFTWEDPSDEVKLGLVAEFAEVARAHGMQLSICSQARYLIPGVTPSRCVDARRLAQLIGRPLEAEVKGNRGDCGCYESRDIGEYDTCPHGCVYCYAVRNRAVAQERFREHDPNGEFLFIPKGKGIALKEQTEDHASQVQGRLL